MIFKENKSIYLQIADRICDEILQSKFKADERIPSVREYATIVEVNANTAMRSFDYLQGEGIIYNKRGIGYFVATDAVKRIKEIRRAQFVNEELPTLFKQMQLLEISISDIEQMYQNYILKPE